MFFVIKKKIIVQSNNEYISFGFDGYLYLSIPLNEKNKFVFMQHTLFQKPNYFCMKFLSFFSEYQTDKLFIPLINYSATNFYNGT